MLSITLPLLLLFAEPPPPCAKDDDKCRNQNLEFAKTKLHNISIPPSPEDIFDRLVARSFRLDTTYPCTEVKTKKNSKHRRHPWICERRKRKLENRLAWYEIHDPIFAGAATVIPAASVVAPPAPLVHLGPKFSEGQCSAAGHGSTLRAA